MSNDAAVIVELSIKRALADLPDPLTPAACAVAIGTAEDEDNEGCAAVGTREGKTVRSPAAPETDREEEEEEE